MAKPLTLTLDEASRRSRRAEYPAEVVKEWKTRSVAERDAAEAAKAGGEVWLVDAGEVHLVLRPATRTP